MVYKKDYGSSENLGGEMIWDLRQIYAIDIVGQTLKDIKVARNMMDFPIWFKLLKRDLFTEINHNLIETEKKEIRDKIKKTEIIILENSGSYTNEGSSPEQVQKLEEALCELEMLLKEKMEEHGMFGQKEEDIGL